MLFHGKIRKKYLPDTPHTWSCKKGHTSIQVDYDLYYSSVLSTISNDTKVKCLQEIIYGMICVAKFDVFVFLFDTLLLLLYIYIFAFNVRLLLFTNNLFCSIFDR